MARCINLLQIVNRRLKVLSVSEDAHPVHQFILHGVADLKDIFLAVLAGDQPVDPFLVFVQPGPCTDGGIELNLVALEELDDLFADDSARHNGLGQGIAAEAVEAVHIPAGGLSGGKKPFQAVGRPVLVGPDPAHGVVLGRADRDQLGDRVDAQEVIADLFHFPELGLDVLGAQVPDIQPEMVAVRAFHAVPCRM